MKTFKKLFLLFILLIPFSSKAVTYSFDKMFDGDAGKGTKFVYIKVSDLEDGIASTDELECSVDSVDVTCLIEPLEGYKIELKRVSKESGELIKSDANVARIVLSNTTKNEVTTKLSLNYGGETPLEDTVKIGEYAPKSTDSTLQELTVSSGVIYPAFKSTENNYTIYGIMDTVRKINFSWKCDNCTVKLEGGTSTSGSNVYINDGENTVKAIVTSQDQNNTTTYNFTVIKGETKFNSNKIKSLSLGDEYPISPTFAADVFEYSVTLPSKITNIEKMLKIELEDSGAKSTVKGASKIELGDNTVTITVEARDGAKQEYTLKVHSEEKEEEIIEVIYYKDKKIAFINSENVREELTEDNFKDKYPKEYEKIKNGEYKFDDEGNIIKNNTVEPVEPVEEKKKEEKKESFPWIIIVLIVVAIIIVVVAGILIFRNPDDKDKKKDEEPEEPTKEELEQLEAIDTYNEEARLIAQNNKEEAMDEISDTIEPEAIESTEETVVKTETIDDFEETTNNPTADIDEALSDLMNTKEYDFKDK